MIPRFTNPAGTQGRALSNTALVVGKFRQVGGQAVPVEILADQRLPPRTLSES
jgi:hypothetical protein